MQILFNADQLISVTESYKQRLIVNITINIQIDSFAQCFLLSE